MPQPEIDHAGQLSHLVTHGLRMVVRKSITYPHSRSDSLCMCRTANGSVPVPPIVWPPLPSAGSRVTSNRRASNGFVWVEVLANSLGAKLLNVGYFFGLHTLKFELNLSNTQYAWGGAIIDNFAWNTTSPLNKTVTYSLLLLSTADMI